MPKNVSDIAIVGGVEGNTRATLRTRLTSLVNGVYRERGGISTRYGTTPKGVYYDTAFGDSAALPVATCLAPYGEDCIRIGGSKLYTWSPALGKRVYRDLVSDVTVTWDGYTNSREFNVDPDIAKAGSVIVVTYRDRSGASAGAYGYVYAVVVDAESGAILREDTLSATNEYLGCRLVVLGSTTVVAVYQKSGTPASIVARTLDVNALSSGWTAQADLKTDVRAGAAIRFDVAAIGSTLYMAYLKASGTYRRAVETFTFSSGTPTNTASATATDSDTSTGPVAIDVDAGANAVWVVFGYYNGANRFVRASVFTANLSSETYGPVTYWTDASSDSYVSLGVSVDSSTGHGAIISTTFNGVVSYDRRFANGASVLAGTAPKSLYNGHITLTKPWWYGGRAYAVVKTLELQPSGIIVDLGLDITSSATAIPARPVATFSVRQFGALNVDAGMPLAKPALLSGSTVYGIPTHYAYSVGTYAIGVARATFGAARQVCEAGTLAFVAGGVPSVFDGTVVSEATYVEIPDAPTPSDAGAGLLGAGTYQYKIVRAWYDSKRGLHRSAPSAGGDVTIGASRNVTVTFRHLSLTTKQDVGNGFASGVLVTEVYRTTAGGSTFYLVGTVANDPTTASNATYTDSSADASIVDNEQLYTESGALDNVCPPSCTIAVTHKNRVWLAGTDDDTIWYSKTISPLEGPAFNEALTIDPFEGGRVTALGASDEGLIVFKRDSLYIVSGDGPDDTGAGSRLSEPRLISSDVGCTDARTVVRTPLGLMFQSRRGIYLLSRGGLELQFVGEDVANLTQASGYSVTSAALVATQSQVRFGLEGASVTDGRVLVYDYLNRAWSVYSYVDTSAAGDYTVRGPVAACIVDGVYWWVTPEGQEYIEAVGSYLDGGETFVQVDWQTSWIKLTGALQGYQRVCRVGMLGERHSAHGLSVYIDTDYDASTVESTAFVEATVTAWSTLEQCEVVPAKQKAQTIRIRVFTSQPVSVGTGRGATFDGITLEWIPQPNKARLASTRRA